MRSLLCILTITLLCAITFTGQSDDRPTLKSLKDRHTGITPKFKVKLLVGCEDDNTKAFIESHIKRELRGLQDVEITRLGQQYELSIVAVESTYKTSGRKIGDIAVASMFLRRYNSGTVIRKLWDAYPVVPKKPKQDDVATLSLELISLYDKEYLGLSTGMRKDLDEICQDIVVDFDTRMLEPDRK